MNYAQLRGEKNMGTDRGMCTCFLYQNKFDGIALQARGGVKTRRAEKGTQN